MVTQALEDEALPRGLMANPRTVVEANYHKPELSAWEGYPCIEALPRLVPRKRMFELIQAHPPYGKHMRRRPAHVRAHMVMDILHFFQPISIHGRLDGMTSRAIHDGYIGRNPLDPRQADSMKERLEFFSEHPYALQYDENAASGFVIVR